MLVFLKSFLVLILYFIIYNLNCFQERGLKKELMVVSQESKLIGCIPYYLPYAIERWLGESGPSLLQRTSRLRI